MRCASWILRALQKALEAIEALDEAEDELLDPEDLADAFQAVSALLLELSQ